MPLTKLGGTYHEIPRETVRPAGLLLLLFTFAFAAYASPNSWVASSRILNFWILPVTVIGKSSTNFT